LIADRGLVGLSVKPIKMPQKSPLRKSKMLAILAAILSSFLRKSQGKQNFSCIFIMLLPARIFSDDEQP
jgi:hypothetical protein